MLRFGFSLGRPSWWVTQFVKWSLSVDCAGHVSYDLGQMAFSLSSLHKTALSEVWRYLRDVYQTSKDYESRKPGHPPKKRGVWAAFPPGERYVLKM